MRLRNSIGTTPALRVQSSRPFYEVEAAAAVLSVLPEPGHITERAALRPEPGEQEGEMAQWKVRTQIAEASLSNAYKQIQQREAQCNAAVRHLAMAEFSCSHKRD